MASALEISLAILKENKKELESTCLLGSAVALKKWPDIYIFADRKLRTDPVGDSGGGGKGGGGGSSTPETVYMSDAFLWEEYYWSNILAGPATVPPEENGGGGGEGA